MENLNEEIADRLISSYDGIYTERALSRKIRNEQPRFREYYSANSRFESMLTRLAMEELEKIENVCGMSPTQKLYYEMYKSGISMSRTAEIFGVSTKNVSIRIHAAFDKIRREYKRGKYYGWYEVYVAEIEGGRRFY